MLGKLYSGTISIPKEIDKTFCSLEKDVVAYNNSTQDKLRTRNFSTYILKNLKLRKIESIKYAHIFNLKKTFHCKYEKKIYPDVSIEVYLLLKANLQKLFRSSDKFILGVNQIRIYVSKNNIAIPAPPLHQDGYDYSIHICINRKNIIGGKTIIHDLKLGQCIEKNLKRSEFVFFDDKYFHHTATTFTCVNPDEIAYRDMIIIDCIKQREMI